MDFSTVSSSDMDMGGFEYEDFEDTVSGNSAGYTDNGGTGESNATPDVLPGSPSDLYVPQVIAADLVYGGGYAQGLVFTDILFVFCFALICGFCLSCIVNLCGYAIKVSKVILRKGGS